MRVAISCGVAASVCFTRRTAAASFSPAARRAMRRSNSARLSAASACSALRPGGVRRLAALAGGAPGVADVVRHLERRLASSRASRARRRSRRRRAASRGRLALPALVGAPKPMVVRQAIMRRAVGRFAPARSRRRSRRDRGRRCGSRSSRRPRSASPGRPSRRATAGRRWRCRCRRTARSAC